MRVFAQVLREKGNRKDVSLYPKTRPALAEAEAIARLLKIAKCVDTPVIIVHLSSKEGYEEVRRAREQGQTVYVETCPQYLLLDESRYLLPGNEGRKYMIAPPLGQRRIRRYCGGRSPTVRCRPSVPITAASIHRRR